MFFTHYSLTTFYYQVRRIQLQSRLLTSVSLQKLEKKVMSQVVRETVRDSSSLINASHSVTFNKIL